MIQHVGSPLRRGRNRRKGSNVAMEHPVKKGQLSPVVEIRYVPTPNAHMRLSRALEIILRSLARDRAQEQDIPAEDVEKAEPY